MAYTYKKRVNLPFEDAVARVRSALAAKGFGVLSEIDVQKVLKEKLGVEHQRYLILGACNPKFSHNILEQEKDIGALLPCNVIVYEDSSHVVVATVLPTSQLSIIGENPSIKAVALTVEEKLKEAVDEV